MLNHWKTEIQPFDERRDIIIPGSYDETLELCVEQLIDLAQAAIQDHGYFCIAVSGGSTPNAIYKKLSLPENKQKIDWSKVLVFWSDERSVPPNDKESNFRMAMEAGLNALPLKPENIFRMIAESDIEHHALDYEKALKKHLYKECFDAVLLGMGEDGHTASLFPQTHGLHVQNRLVIGNFVPQKNTWRMSLTYACINAARTIIIYVLGKNKAPMVQRTLLGPYEPDLFPIQKVGTLQHRALWVLDQDAASLLEKNL